jgi:hypothetical protein
LIGFFIGTTLFWVPAIRFSSMDPCVLALR